MNREFQERFKKAKINFEAFGPLGVTAEDHKGIGSTPPEILEKNPGKTESDLMTDEDLAQWLKEKEEELKKYSGKEYLDNAFAQSYLPTLKEEIKTTINFLRSINRLPEKFRDRKIE